MPEGKRRKRAAHDPDGPALRDFPYFELPLLLGLLELPPLELPLGLLELLLGELGLVVLLGLLELLPAPEELPPVAPLLELDLLKYASHSERDTWPSLFLSTLVKLGAELDAPLELEPLDMPELPPLEAPDELLGEELEELGDELDELPPLEAPEEPLLPVALGEDDDLSLLDAPVDEEPELCAMDTLASANSAAAVAVVINFNFIGSFLLNGKWGVGELRHRSCNACAYGVPRRGSRGVTPSTGVARAGSTTWGRPDGVAGV
jgi:hypothetical protein